MNPTKTVTLYQRCIASFLALLIGLGPIATPAYAALTSLADEPLNIRNQAKPNIMLTVDDSSSMLFDYLPDYVVDAYCRNGTGAMGAACGNGGVNFDLSPQGRGRYRSPGYVYKQFGASFPAYNATPNYDASGPGEGCDLRSPASSLCAGGVDPGPLPGIKNYPASQPFPKGGNPYEYWMMWPAVAHNSAFNHLYYNPRLVYDPPADSTGASYPQMNAANTTNWTQVPADTWSTPIKLVDLTAPVNVGLWCNSDWNQGINPVTSQLFSTDAAFCRSNGVVAPAASGAAASDGDYTYPWPWPGNPAAKDPKYFAQNDNTLWCDTTSPDWPQTGAPVPQSCNGYGVVGQTCDGLTPQTCGGGTPQTCNNVRPQTCGGAQNQTCNNVTTPQTCGGSTGQTCGGLTSQTCGGVQNQTCAGISSQTCGGAQTQSCNVSGQTCNNVRSQTCANIHRIDPDPASCSIDWNDPSCAIVPRPEGVECHLVTNCPPPTFAGNCSITAAVCTTDAECPTQPGLCSISNASCFSDAACGSIGACSVSGGGCSTNADCSVTPGSCTVSGASCTTNADCSSVGHCTVVNNVCGSNADCPTQPGTCSITLNGCFDNTACLPANGACTATNAACTADAQCPTVSGACSTTGSVCTGNVDCPNTGRCSINNATVCTTDAQCPVVPGACTVTSASCTTDANCPTQPGTCSATLNGCFDVSSCPVQGTTCSITGNACSGSCPDMPGHCSINVGTSCSFGGDPVCGAVTTNGTCSNPSSPVTSCQGFGEGNCPRMPSAGSGATCSDPMGAVRLLNPGMESPSVGGGSYVYSPGGASWSFVSAGIQSNGSAWGAANAPEGSQTAFLQGISATMTQTLTFTAGNYTLSFYAAQRGGQIQPIQLLIDNVPIGSTITPTSSNFALYTTVSFSVTAGFHSITLAGTVGGDNSSFVDAVTLNGGSAMSLLEDSAGAGKACRRNNQSYAATTIGGRAEPAVAAGRFNFPDAHFNVPVTGGVGPNACVATDRYASVPRHYWKTEVEWCDHSIATMGDKWNGYGTATGGTCQPSKDDTHTFPRFYRFGTAAATSNYTTPAFERVDLIPASTYTHNWLDEDNIPQTLTRTYAEEMTNYANWFAYYRTRVLATKTVTSLTFKELDDQSRVGFHTLSNVPTTSFVPVAPFDASQKATWFSKLFGINITALDAQTPTLDAMIRVGDYYSATAGPLPVTPDPIVLSCQKNFHMLFTDGFTNQPAPVSVAGDMDETVTVLPVPVTGLAVGDPWPSLYRQGLRAVSNSASDYATKYWLTDIRPGACTICINNVTADPSDINDYTKDPATWQHVNFAAISLGTAGDLPNADPAVTETGLRTGTLRWPTPQPTTNRPDQSGVDDLWHAGINGHGGFVNAQDADDLKIGMGQILQSFKNQTGARAGVGFANPNFTLANKFVYRVTFGAGWSGNLSKVEIDPSNNGAEVAVLWSAATQLTAQLTPTVPDPKPFDTVRKIVTLADSNSGPGVPFRWNNLSAAEKDSLAPGNVVKQKAVLDFLRGDRAKEGTRAGRFRVRSGVLGDIVDSQAAIVGPPKSSYDEGQNAGYDAFKQTNAGRPTRVYVGANDGMLHVFDDVTGNETWAYVPKALYRPDSTGLAGLAIQDGALPAFRHHFYVDGSPKVIDANLGGTWKSLLVGGLGKGGRSYYALDATDPSNVATEVAATNKILWEWTNGDMGYSYGKAIISKTHAFGGKWVVIAPSGYNNPSGVGKIFVIDAADGTLLKTLSTGAGSAASPLGLAHISGYTKTKTDQLTEQVYGGDLYGNLWRFDVSSADDSAWTVVKMAVLTAPDGTLQPVTTDPQIEVDVLNGVDRWVFVGTGRLLDNPDLANTQRQTFYAIRDGSGSTPNADASYSSPLVRANLVPIPADRIAALPAKPDKGWYDDLPAGERIIIPPQAELNIAAYTATAPQTDECLTGQPSTAYARNYADGESLFETPGVAIAEGAVGLDVISVQADSTNPATEIRISITLGTSGVVRWITPRQPTFLNSHRMSWRLLGQ